jgi:hypothetical protein
VWQSPDPIIGEFLNGGGNSGFYNTKNLGFYSYSYNNPVILVDPDGNNPGPMTYPGVMPIVDMQSGYAAVDNTVLGAANTALNIVGGTVNIAVDAVGAVGAVGERFAGEIQSASGALPGPGQAGGRGLGVAVLGASKLLSRVGDLNKAAKVTAADRATQIHSILDPRAQRARTTAVTETQEGVRIVSSSERRLTPAQRAQLGASEVEGIGVGHAEVTGINAAREMGLTPTATAASRPICTSCAGTLREQNIDPLSPLK